MTRNSVPALIASAVRIHLTSNTMPRKTADWQKEAWVGYEAVGEAQHGIDYIANLISKVRLYGATLPDDPRDPPVKDTDERANGAIRNLKTEGGDYSSVLRELVINLHVAGECYLVGKGNSENEVDAWNIYSSDELEYGNDERFRIREYPSGPVTEYSKNSIIVIRIYFPHPRWGGLPISPLRGVLSSLEEIQRIERVIRGAAISRSAGPGLLLVPDEASFADPAPENNSDDGESTTPIQGDPFVNKLIHAMVTPIQEEGSAASAVPIVVRAPADVLKEFRKLDLSIAVDTELIKLERAITRLAQGLPLPPEVVTGKAGLNHWTSFQVSEETITAYVEPLLGPILMGLTVEWYRPLLVALGMSEEEASNRVLAADVTALVTRPNRSADADFGLEHMAISDEEWRKVKGFTGEAAPTDLQKLAGLMLQRGSFDPQTTAALLKVIGIIPEDVELPSDKLVPPTPAPSPGQRAETRDPPTPNRRAPSAPSPGSQRSAASAVMFLPSAAPDDDLISSQLAEIDRDLRVRLQTAAEAAVHRSLERAGASVIQKLAKKSRYSTLMRDIPKLEAAAQVGRMAVEAEGVEVAALFSGAFTPFIAKFKDWTARAYSRSSRILSIPIPTPIDLISSAADQFTTDLTSFAIDRLFDLTAGSEPYGEADPDSLLPHGIIRNALYRAGGGTSLLPSSTSPPGGISTGTNVLTAILDAGGNVDGFEWLYADIVRTRDFPPHAQLNGVRFSSFSDPVLRNPGTWPPVTMLYAGDHSSCGCGIRPLIRLPAQEASA